MDTNNPLLLTVSINEEAKDYFTALRKKHFPSDRNFLDAHLMLFHQLPPNEEAIVNGIRNMANNTPPILLQVAALSSIGNGVAYKIESNELANLHRQLQVLWEQWLIPQDTHKLWPHITVQNKVLPAVAKALLANLSEGFKPFEITGTGLALWEYKGGPWQFIAEYKFTGKPNQ